MVRWPSNSAGLSRLLPDRLHRSISISDNHRAERVEHGLLRRIHRRLSRTLGSRQALARGICELRPCFPRSSRLPLEVEGQGVSHHSFNDRRVPSRLISSIQNAAEVFDTTGCEAFREIRLGEGGDSWAFD